MKMHGISKIGAAAVLAAAGLSANDAEAAVPKTLTEQGRLFTSAGAPAVGTVTMTFRIYDAPVGGTMLWQEAQIVTLDDGYFSAQIGGVTPFGPTVWNGSLRYVGVTVNNDAEMTPRQSTASVPYALVAEDAVGDIHPTSVSVGGQSVIDGQGNWVGGSVRVGPAAICSPQAAGTLRWTGLALQVCDGTSWVGVGNGAGSCGYALVHQQQGQLCADAWTRSCTGVPIGEFCAGGVYAGNDGYADYVLTPPGCTDSAQPQCDGSADSVTKTWGAEGIATGVSNIHNGKDNTSVLASTYADAHAAQYCQSMAFAGKDDWFLPAYNVAATLLRPKLSELGLRNDVQYLTSTEGGYSGSVASIHVAGFGSPGDFSGGCGGSLCATGKSIPVHVRCVRRIETSCGYSVADIGNGTLCADAFTRPCTLGSAIGELCSGGVYAGSHGGNRYVVTPSGCTDSQNPVCNGGVDSVMKIWGANGITTGVSSFTNGPGNTAALASGWGDTHAAKYCDGMSYGGATDWFLPDYDVAANLLRPQRTELGLRTDVQYLTSTEGGYSGSVSSVHVAAFGSPFDFSGNCGGSMCAGGKNVPLHVRCVRRF
jgi:hypothetical protein